MGKKQGKKSMTSRLVFTPTQRVIASWNDDEIEFNDSILRSNMEKRGISIPTAVRPDFEGRVVILPSDPNQKLFIQAFKECYLPFSYPKNEYSVI